MGMYSYLCKECGHPMLSREAADVGLNDWMCQVVALGSDGDVAQGEFDGYGRVAGDSVEGHTAWLHQACWKVAGEPQYDRYGTPSTGAPDQGWFFDDGAHDLIDPRIKEGREELLAQGRATRTQGRYDARAKALLRSIEDAEDSEIPREERQAPWREHFDRAPIHGGTAWMVINRFTGECLPQQESQEAADAACEAALRALVASDEGKALVSRARELRAEEARKHLEWLRSAGRYVVRQRRSSVRGDMIEGFTTARSCFLVVDQLTYDDVAMFDYEGSPHVYQRQPGYQGNHSPAWEARVEVNAQDHTTRHAKAEAEAKRLNQVWADNGYPST